MNKKLEKEIKHYVWGPVVTVHTIGEYDIIEHHPQIFKDCCGTGEYDLTKSEFHPYINGEDTSMGCNSLDGALITAMSIKYDGLNTRVPQYIGKIFGW